MTTNGKVHKRYIVSALSDENRIRLLKLSFVRKSANLTFGLKSAFYRFKIHFLR